MPNQNSADSDPKSRRIKTFLQEWERMDRELFGYLYTDPAFIERMSPEEVEDTLREMGIDPKSLAGEYQKILADSQAKAGCR